MIRRSQTKLAAILVGLLSVVASSLAAGAGIASPPGTASPPSEVGPGPDGDSNGPAGVTDHVDLGEATSESDHALVDDGATEATSGTVTAGQVTEDYTARDVRQGGRFDVTLDVHRGQPLTLQLRELRPDGAWGAAFGFRVYIDDQLVYVRDNAIADPGGGPYSSVFLEAGDHDILADGTVTVTIEGTSAEPAAFDEIWAFSNLGRMVEQQDMRVPDRLVFLLGQDYLPESTFRQRLDYVTENFQETDQVKLGFAVLDYFPNRNAQQMAENYQSWLELSREYGLPFAIEGTSDWEGTPSRVPDGKGGFFGDLEYQQVLWSPQDQTGPDQDVYTNPAGEVQRLDEFLGEDYEPRHGLSVPNVWGSTPWLTWHHPDLNAFYQRKANESLDQIRPFVWDLQHSDEADRILPFSTANESVYWSKRNNIGVWDIVYTGYNGGVERRDIYADLNPYTVAAAAEDGVVLDPTDGGWSAEEKAWLYQNQSYHQQLFADVFYAGLPRERIEATGNTIEFPTDMLRHNIHSEIYSRLQEPYYSAVFPSIAQGIVERARPGSQFISLDNYTPGGFYHLQKSREFGRIANPNLENSVSTRAPDKTLLLRQLYINGSRYTTPYNWRTAAPDEAKDWITPFLEDMDPWDVVHDEAPDGRVSDQAVVSQTFTAGELRLVDRIDVQLERIGPPAPLRLTVREGSADGPVVGMRHLGESEVPEDGWASFYLPVMELDVGQTYHVEIEQLDGDAPVDGRARSLPRSSVEHLAAAAYAYPTAGGDLLYRVGLDMDFERDRSLMIQWRRDAADAIKHVGADTGPADARATDLLTQASSALDADRYVEAYELAMQADSMRFPVLYQTSGRSNLDPFPLSVESSFDTDVDVNAHDPRRRLELTVRGYESGTASFTARSLAGARVFVDREEVEVTRHGRNAVTFHLDLDAGRSYEVLVLAEGEEPPPPHPSEPPIVTGVDAPAPMFNGRANTVSVTVDNTTNDDVPVTASMVAPDGWSAGEATVTIPARQTGQVDIEVTPPADPTLSTTLQLEVTAPGHEVRDGSRELELIAVPHPDDVELALDAGTISSPVVEGYQQLAPEHFWEDARGYGWADAPPQSRDRGAVLDPVRRDFVNDVAVRPLRIAVPAGTHEVYLLVGDASFPSTPTYVRSGGELLAASEALAAGEFTWLRFAIDGGTSGRQVDLALESDPNQHWHLNALVVR